MKPKKYPGFEREMRKRRYTRKDVAQALGLSVSATYQILTGKHRLTLEQALTIRDKLFPELTLDELWDQEVKEC